MLYFEGDRHASYRILRAVKNRFGSTNEIGVFEMQGTGLEEVSNPSEYLLEGRPENASGCVVACSMEGTTADPCGNTGIGLREQFWYSQADCCGNGF